LYIRNNSIWPLEDGKVLLSISECELLQEEIALFPSMMVRNGRIYKMLPSVSGSLAMLIDFLHEKTLHRLKQTKRDCCIHRSGPVAFLIKTA